MRARAIAPSSPESDRFAELRAREFRRLDEAGHAYLDHTGSALYAERQVREHRALLLGSILGNPHSENPASRRSTELVEDARERVLRFFRADPAEYCVVFTANTTGAVGLVAESFRFRPGSRLVLSADSHNSVNGIREYAARAAAEVRYVPLDAELRMRGAEASLASAPAAPSLFAFSAQSNFSGVRHSLELVGHARRLGYRVLLDAAAFVPTSPLDLGLVRPDFVALSFYKMFGYPTGVGALVARHEALAELRRPSFSGGTVDWVSVQSRLHRLRPGPEGFEDGTPNFAGVAGLASGLRLLGELGMDAVRRHVAGLTGELLELLKGLRHPCGAPLVRIYGPANLRARGGTVAFNVLAADGSAVPYWEVERRAGERGISLRGGCFCNPGCAEAAFGFPADAALRCFRRQDGRPFSIPELAECMPGRPVGAVRASLGISSNAADVRRLGELLEEFAEAPVLRSAVA